MASTYSLPQRRSSVSRSRGRRATSSIVPLLLIVLTFAPSAGAQERPAPAPEELWRQFPLNDARAEQPPTFEAPRRRERSTPEAGPSGGENLSVLGLGAIGLATVLLVAVAGVLVALLDRLRARNRPYASASRSGGSRRLPAASGRSEQMDELEILKIKREADRRTAKTAGSSVDQLEVLKAKLVAPAARKEARATADDLEILKSKRQAATSAAVPDGTRSDGIEALKRKRNGVSAANRETAKPQTADPLQAKLAKRTDSPDSPVPDARKPRAKLGLVPGAPAQRAAPAPTNAPGSVGRPSTNRSARRPRGAAAVAPLALPLDELTEPVERLPRVRCRVALWRGYVKSQFYAIELRAPQAPRVFAESPLFRIRGGGLPPQHGASADAHATLIANLEQAGWCVVARGLRWYHVELERVEGRERQGKPER